MIELKDISLVDLVKYGDALCSAIAIHMKLVGPEPKDVAALLSKVHKEMESRIKKMEVANDRAEREGWK